MQFGIWYIFVAPTTDGAVIIEGFEASPAGMYRHERAWGNFKERLNLPEVLVTLGSMHLVGMETNGVQKPHKYAD